MTLRLNRYFTWIWSIASVILLSACTDDFDRFNGTEIRPGYSTVTLSMDFEPMTPALESRATVAPGGDRINGIKDLCILFYDQDGNLIKDEDGDDMVYYWNTDASAKPAGLKDSYFVNAKFTSVNDADPDHTTNDEHLAQSSHVTGKIENLPLPNGKYHIIGVANLGNTANQYNGYSESTNTYTELYTHNADEMKTVEGIRNIRLKWDTSNIENNAEMFGSFSEDQSSAGASSNFSLDKLIPVSINKNGMTLTSWLRRAASKVTIAFDASNLRDKIYIYLKSATIKDIPLGCTLGKSSMVTTKDSIIPVSSHHIDYYDTKKTEAQFPGIGNYENFAEWPFIVTEQTYPSGAKHTETEASLFFYENVQGISEEIDNKVQKPDPNNPGFVLGKDDLKDKVPYGTYIEVEAYYRSVADQLPTSGKIIYRFMLGKNTTNDFNAERNHHYKLTLKFNGNANDIDWHIEYDEDEGIKVPIPYYYVPYLYNQEMEYPVTVIGKIAEGAKLEAKIIKSEWMPYDPDVYGEGNGDHPSHSRFEYFSGTATEDGPWHGFLSLRRAPTDPEEGHKELKTIIGKGKKTDAQYTDPDKIWQKKYLYNHLYWAGKGDEALNEKVNPRGERSYLQTGEVDIVDGSYTVTPTTKNGKAHTVFNIPMYSREMDLVKVSGYRGNNPFIGYYRYAEVEFSIKMASGNTSKTVAKLLQVPRIVNPVGVYRSWNNSKPFDVKMYELDDDEAEEYTEVISKGGPWAAQIECVGETDEESNVTSNGGWIALNGKTAVGTDIVKGKTETPIEFKITFSGGTGSAKKVRYAIIKITYHNNTCTHRMIIRQGYEPKRMTDIANTDNPNSGSIDNAKWHVFNLDFYDKDTKTAYLTQTPMDEGSMFRNGNPDQGIASSNNTLNDRFTAPDEFQLAPYPKRDYYEKEGGKAKWENITYQTPTTGFTKFNPKIYGRDNVANTKVHVATLQNFVNLRMSCDFISGILYGDDATYTFSHTYHARSHGSYNTDDPRNSTYGMRGWFVYNMEKGGSNIFFPIGVSGLGRRKHGIGYSTTVDEKKTGTLRYANRSAFMDGAELVPLFATIYKQRGAIYWLDGSSYDSGYQGQIHYDGANAWDINYSTFDFNTFDKNATDLFKLGSGKASDACFLRLIEDE